MAEIRIYKAGNHIVFVDIGSFPVSDIAIDYYAGGVRFSSISRSSRIGGDVVNEFTDIKKRDGSPTGANTVDELWDYLLSEQTAENTGAVLDVDTTSLENTNKELSQSKRLASKSFIDSSTGRKSYLHTIYGNRVRFTDTDVYNDIFDFSDSQQKVISASDLSGAFSVSSSRNSDNQIITFSYIDTSGSLISLDIQLNGSTSVSFLPLQFDSYLKTELKSPEPLSGDLSIERGSVQFSSIREGENRNYEAIFTVPSGFDCYLQEFSVFSERARARFKASCDTVLKGSFTDISSLRVASDSSNMTNMYEYHINEGVTIKASAKSESSQNSREASCKITLYLVSKS